MLHFLIQLPPAPLMPQNKSRRAYVRTPHGRNLIPSQDLRSCCLSVKSSYTQNNWRTGSYFPRNTHILAIGQRHLADRVLRSTVTRLPAISNQADFMHDVSTVHRCPRLWTPDGIVTNRDAVSFWVHGVYPVSRCPMGQGGARRFVPFGIRAQFSCPPRRTGNAVVEMSSKLPCHH
jgi:hypothetical protein